MLYRCAGIYAFLAISTPLLPHRECGTDTFINWGCHEVTPSHSTAVTSYKRLHVTFTQPQNEIKYNKTTLTSSNHKDNWLVTAQVFIPST